ncbi:uncharacterized protein LOC130624193 [Hydractinia symbiolongicarpus]|uniref:uncharacterized protein LOC130624193 n=1 Tax=Hydractinia symbiolongicarpus TaxID=13093 RepID=UPI00254D875C|nr:uncharacterized protein LOC130624193 [Hydractinia symbiolongicarpus]
MGIKFSFPLQQIPIAYHPASYFTCIGTRRKDDYTQDTTFFHKLQERYWEDLLEERTRELLAKNKFKDVDVEAQHKKYVEKFPKFTLGEISDLKLQFQTFDLNQDGLIDCNELMQVLDDLGDKSSLEKRQEYFEEIDEDGSGAIDFEEFMGLIYDLKYMQSDKKSGEDIRLLCKLGNDHYTLRKLSLSEKMSRGLF